MTLFEFVTTTNEVNYLYYTLLTIKIAYYIICLVSSSILFRISIMSFKQVVNVAFFKSFLIFLSLGNGLSLIILIQTKAQPEMNKLSLSPSIAHILVIALSLIVSLYFYIKTSIGKYDYIDNKYKSFISFLSYLVTFTLVVSIELILIERVFKLYDPLESIKQQQDKISFNSNIFFQYNRDYLINTFKNLSLIFYASSNRNKLTLIFTYSITCLCGSLACFTFNLITYLRTDMGDKSSCVCFSFFFICDLLTYSLVVYYYIRYSKNNKTDDGLLKNLIESYLYDNITLASNDSGEGLTEKSDESPKSLISANSYVDVNTETEVNIDKPRASLDDLGFTSTYSSKMRKSKCDFNVVTFISSPTRKVYASKVKRRSTVERSKLSQDFVQI